MTFAALHAHAGRENCYVECSDIVYYGDSDFVSNSMLKAYRESPFAYYRRYVARDMEKKETPAMLLGKAVHTAVFEPDEFVRRFAFKPRKYDLRKNADKDDLAVFTAAHAGKCILEPDDYPKVTGIANAVYRNPAAAKLLKRGQAERAVAWTCPDTGVKCKAKIDFCDDSTGVVVDLKTTRNINAVPFARDAHNFEYHCQEAFYRVGTGRVWDREPMAVKFYFIAVTNQEPYESRVYALGDDDVHLGATVNRNTLRQLAASHSFADWNGQGFGEIVPLRLPKYAHYLGDSDE